MIIRQMTQATLAMFLMISLGVTHSMQEAVASESIIGYSHPFRSANVAASTSGIMKKWLIEEGQVVSKGQPLAKLDDTVHRSFVAIAKAAMLSQGELVMAEAEQKLRQQRLQAIRSLAKQGHATPDELHRAQSEADVAAARLMTAKEHRLQRELEYEKFKVQAEAYTIVAPFDGVIKEIYKHSGEYVGPAEPAICELADLITISASFLLPKDYTGKIATGALVQVYFPSISQSLEGTASLSPYPDAETGMRAIKVKIPNAEGKIKAGWQCQLQINK